MQRGAQIFFNNCSGCHTLQYHRYSKLVEDLNISEEMVKSNLILTTQKGEKTKLGSTITNAINHDSIKEAFGVVPPDLDAYWQGREDLSGYILFSHHFMRIILDRWA